MKKDFLYYLEDLETLKPKKFANPIEILQLSPGTRYNPIHRHYFINLYVVFHPDKVCAADKLKAKACFDLIYPAVCEFASLTPKPAPIFEDLIDELFPVSAGKAMLSIKDSFDKLHSELISQQADASSTQSSVTSKAEQQEKRRLFSILKAKASTPEEFIKLLKFQSVQSNEKSGELGHPAGSVLLQRAVNAGNPEAILMTTHYILLGYYGSDAAHIAWAFNNLRYIDSLLKLDLDGHKVNILGDFTALCQGLQKNMDIVIPGVIPENCQELIDHARSKINKIKRSRLLYPPVLMNAAELSLLIKSNFDKKSVKDACASKENYSILGSIWNFFSPSSSNENKHNPELSCAAAALPEPSLDIDQVYENYSLENDGEDEDYIVVGGCSDSAVSCPTTG